MDGIAVRGVVKAAAAANLAGVIRWMRFGVSDALDRLEAAFNAVDPFERRVSATDRRNLDTLREVPLADIVSSVATVPIDPGHVHRDGALPIGQLIALLALALDRRPRIVLEIGTYFGTTTKALALALPSATIHTVDLPLDFAPADAASGVDDHHLIARRNVGVAFRDGPANIVQHLVDTASWDFLAAQGAELVFIDGSHTYEYVKNDTMRCLEMCAPQATIVWHDCDRQHPGVVRWLAEMVDRGHPIVRLAGTPLAVLRRG